MAAKELFRITSKTNNLTFCAFYQKVVFGVFEDDTFKDNAYFEFNLNDICDLFCGLFYIVKGFTKPNTELKGTLCKKNENLYYEWEIDKHMDGPIIKLRHKNQDCITFEQCLTVPDFNDVVLLLGHLILPSLNLKDKEYKVFKLILTLDLEQILKFKNEAMIITFLSRKDNSFDLNFIEVHSLALLIYYHLDLLVAIHNLRSLYNPALNITHRNIDMMLSCH